MKFLAFTLILALASLTMNAQSDKLYVLDNAKLLSPDQKKDINDLLHQYFTTYHFEFGLITTSNPTAGSIDDFSNKMVKNLAPGFPGLNNYSLLIISMSSKEIKIKAGEGMIWQLPSETQKEIVDRIKKDFLIGEFFSGIKTGFELMKEKAAPVVWKISYQSFKELSFDLKNSTGKIITTQVSAISTKFNHPETTKVQFHPSYFITVSGDNNTEARLIYSNEMIGSVKQLFQGPSKIYARVSKNQPLELQLLGVVK